MTFRLPPRPGLGGSDFVGVAAAAAAGGVVGAAVVAFFACALAFAFAWAKLHFFFKVKT